MYFNVKLTKSILALSVLIFSLVATIMIWGSQNLVQSVLAQDAEDFTKLPIIMYHAITQNAKKTSKFIVSEEEFEGDLKYIKENGYTTIVMQDLIDYVYNGKDLPEKPIMITFDDGYYNNYLYAFPLLKKYECKMVLSPIGKQIDIYSEIEDRNPAYAHVTWENLKEMVDSGLVEVQNHSYDMHSVGKKRRGTRKNKNESMDHYRKMFSEDVEKSQQEMDEHLGIKPTTFTFPFGSVSSCSIDILKEMGFVATLGCEGKINKLTREPDKLFGLCRILRPGRSDSKKFFTSKIEK